MSQIENDDFHKKMAGRIEQANNRMRSKTPMSSQIENAAREIARKYIDDSHDASNGIERADIEHIIRRNLFPVVTEPQEGKIYWVKAGISERYYLSTEEIPAVGPWTYYGPIPEPG